MKVLYHIPINERIAKARTEALLAQRAVDKIILTEAEMDELAAWCESCMYMAPGGIRWLNKPKAERVTHFMGIRIEQEQ